MRCFVHHDTEAVGICRVCGKGLCPACAADSGTEYGLACQGACEPEAQALRAQVLRNRAMIQAQRQTFNRFFQSAFLTSMGALIVFNELRDHRPNPGLIAMGGLFIAFGLLLAFLQQRFKRATNRDSH